MVDHHQVAEPAQPVGKDDLPDGHCPHSGAGRGPDEDSLPGGGRARALHPAGRAESSGDLPLDGHRQPPAHLGELAALGRLGIRLVNVGEYLDAGKPIVSLQSLSPIYVEFSLPQQELGKLKTGLPVQFSTDAFPDRKFAGELTAINPALDSGTRSVRVQATIANEEQLLRPGMFARVEVLLPTSDMALVIPVTAVLSAPFGDSVYVIEPKPADTNGPAGLVVRQQIIRTGYVRGDFVSVESGLKAGEKVVSAGQFKLRKGMMVQENNELTPKASEKPRPSDG